MLLVGQQEEHPACKNFCLKTPSDIVMVVNVSGQGTARCSLWACPMRMLRIRMSEG